MAIDDKSRRAYHPAVSISSWLIVAMAIELASPTQLQWFVVLAAFLLAGGGAQRFAQLMWRARWLWLALACLYAWTVPGTLLWPSEYSPSIEGLQAGFMRIARLALMLAALARLLTELTAQQLAGGLYLMAKPLCLLGLDRRALAVRLALTLEYLEQRGNGRGWLEELKMPYHSASGPDEMRFTIVAAGWRDMLLLFAAIALLAGVLGRLAA